MVGRPFLKLQFSGNNAAVGRFEILASKKIVWMRLAAVAGTLSARLLGTGGVKSEDGRSLAAIPPIEALHRYNA